MTFSDSIDAGSPWKNNSKGLYKQNQNIPKFIKSERIFEEEFQGSSLIKEYNESKGKMFSEQNTIYKLINKQGTSKKNQIYPVFKKKYLLILNKNI